MLQAQLEAPRTDALTPSSRPSAWRQRCVSGREAGTRAPPLLTAPLRRQQQVLRPGQRENTAERRAHREPAPPAPSPHPPPHPAEREADWRSRDRGDRRALPAVPCLAPAPPARGGTAPPRPARFLCARAVTAAAVAAARSPLRASWPARLPARSFSPPPSRFPPLPPRPAAIPLAAFPCPARHVAGRRPRGGLLQRGAADPPLPPASRLPRRRPARPVRAAPERAPLRPGRRGLLLRLDAHPLGRALRQGGARHGGGREAKGRRRRRRAAGRRAAPSLPLCALPGGAAAAASESGAGAAAAPVSPGRSCPPRRGEPPPRPGSGKVPAVPGGGSSLRCGGPGSPGPASSRSGRSPPHLDTVVLCRPCYRNGLAGRLGR